MSKQKPTLKPKIPRHIGPKSNIQARWLPIYVHHERSLYMSKSLTIWALIVALAVAGCLTEGQFLASRQPTAIQVAVSRGQSEMNCPAATGEVLSQELTQPALQGPIVQGESRGLFTIGVAGFGQRRVYQVFCPMGGDSC